ncbi:MAG: response regulator, partial [Bdellovibrionaceae bacterium]|nr:response regulator [Pseudobdellovibrionaceae bacterium]
MTTNDLGQKIRAFIGDGSCVIIEPSASFSANLQTCLADMGVPLSQVSTFRRFDEALQFIRTAKPKLLVTEYDIPRGSGLALVEAQEALFEEEDRISIMVTRNSSDSAVAQSAEGAVDAFILKPFSTDVFRAKTNEVFERKLNPSPYELKLREARKLLVQKDFEAALLVAQDAKALEAKPSMACYYAGLALKEQGRQDEALNEFREGLLHHSLHYKCLIGELEVLMDRKDYATAYQSIPQIRHHYPVTTQRLGQFLIAAVFTYHFDDLPDYYQLFVDAEDRTPWLTELIGLALLTAG